MGPGTSTFGVVGPVPFWRCGEEETACSDALANGGHPGPRVGEPEVPEPCRGPVHGFFRLPLRRFQTGPLTDPAAWKGVTPGGPRPSNRPDRPGGSKRRCLAGRRPGGEGGSPNLARSLGWPTHGGPGRGGDGPHPSDLWPARQGRRTRRWERGWAPGTRAARWWYEAGGRLDLRWGQAPGPGEGAKRCEELLIAPRGVAQRPRAGDGARFPGPRCSGKRPPPLRQPGWGGRPNAPSVAGPALAKPNRGGGGRPRHGSGRRVRHGTVLSVARGPAPLAAGRPYRQAPGPGGAPGLLSTGGPSRSFLRAANLEEAAGRAAVRYEGAGHPPGGPWGGRPLTLAAGLHAAATRRSRPSRHTPGGAGLANHRRGTSRFRPGPASVTRLQAGVFAAPLAGSGACLGRAGWNIAEIRPVDGRLATNSAQPETGI